MEQINLKLPRYPYIYIELISYSYGVGRINSNLSEAIENGSDVLESFILACFCSGVDVTSVQFIEALETTIEASLNHS